MHLKVVWSLHKPKISHIQIIADTSVFWPNKKTSVDYLRFLFFGVHNRLFQRHYTEGMFPCRPWIFSGRIKFFFVKIYFFLMMKLPYSYQRQSMLYRIKFLLLYCFWWTCLIFIVSLSFFRLLRKPHKFSFGFSVTKIIQLQRTVNRFTWITSQAVFQHSQIPYIFIAKRCPKFLVSGIWILLVVYFLYWSVWSRSFYNSFFIRYLYFGGRWSIIHFCFRF